MNKTNKQIIFITTIIGLVMPLLYTKSWSGWTGFGQDTITTKEKLVNGNVTKIIEQTKSGKALWDWLELLLVPGFLAWLSYKLGEIEQKRADQFAKIQNTQAEIQNRQIEQERTNQHRQIEKERADQLRQIEQERTDQYRQIEQERADQYRQIEQKRAANNLRNEAQQAYFNRMENLLLNKSPEILESDKSLRELIRIYTGTILRRLQGDKELTDDVLSFLRDSDLLKFALENAILKNIKFDKPDLFKANFKGAILENIKMVEAILIEANLEGAILTNAQLEVAALAKANLKEAHLEGANLKGANLQGANLEGAYLEETDLEKANLEGAINLNPKQVKAAKNWKEADYDEEFENLLDIANN